MFRHSDRFKSGMLIGALVASAMGAAAILFGKSKQGKKLQKEVADRYHDLEKAASKLEKKARTKMHSIEKEIKSKVRKK